MRAHAFDVKVCKKSAYSSDKKEPFASVIKFGTYIKFQIQPFDKKTTVYKLAFKFLKI